MMGISGILLGIPYIIYFFNFYEKSSLWNKIRFFSVTFIVMSLF